MDTAKVKSDSNYIYAGLILEILGVYEIHTDQACHDIYPVGSVTYKLSLKGTDWEEQKYTVIHDSHLENITIQESTDQAYTWKNKFDTTAWIAISNLLNPNGDKSLDEMYKEYMICSFKALLSRQRNLKKEMHSNLYEKHKLEISLQELFQEVTGHQSNSEYCLSPEEKNSLRTNDSFKSYVRQYLDNKRNRKRLSNMLLKLKKDIKISQRLQSHG